MNAILSLFGLGEIQRTRRRAQRGDMHSSYQLALLLIDKYRNSGLRVPDCTEKEIITLLEQSAGAGNIDAAYLLGSKYCKRNWLRHAARNGHLEAAIKFAELICRERYAAVKELEGTEEAFQLALSAFEAGHKRGANVLQDMYLGEVGCTFDANKYFSCLNNAQYQTPIVKARKAWCHIFGVGTPISIKKADEIFHAIHDGARIEAIHGKDTEEPSLWLYTYNGLGIAQHKSLPAVANIAKYIVRFMGGVSAFLSKLEKQDADALYLHYLAIKSFQLHAPKVTITTLLDQAADKNFPPALLAKAKTLSSNDSVRMRLIKKAGNRGYLPAQIVIAESATGKFHKTAWKTVIRAQENFYKFQISDYGEIPPLVPDMEDFTLRGLGFAGGASEIMSLSREDQVPEESMAEFFDVLLTIYAKYVKPFRPVSRKSILNAIYNVTNYDLSDEEGHPQRPPLPPLP